LLISLSAPFATRLTLRFDHDPRWAETGDRYLIKLFRDYVFHQVDETGRPVTDLGHVLGALNKVCLHSRPLFLFQSSLVSFPSTLLCFSVRWSGSGQERVEPFQQRRKTGRADAEREEEAKN
jgi:hypothetical protein